MAALKIRSLLTSGELAALCGRVRHLTELQQVFLDAAPPPLAQASRVSNCRAGKLFVLADNAAVAAKLRQIAPRLLVKMRKRVPEITGIQIDVQVSLPRTRAPGAPHKSTLAPETIEKIRVLTEAVPPSPLKSALAAMVRRHTGTMPADQTTSTRRSRT